MTYVVVQFEFARRMQTTELWEHHDNKSAAEKYALEACKYQASCNLTKQAQAKKAKKSLNIIHIGNICMYPYLCVHRPWLASYRVSKPTPY
jgi:hypothetical protein